MGTSVDFLYYFYLNKKGMFFVFSFIIAFLSGFIVSYDVHKNITFRNLKDGRRQWKQYLKVSIKFLIIGLVMTCLLVIFSLLLQLQWEWFKWLNKNSAKGIVGLILLWPNYIATKDVFRKKSKKPDTP
jgi:putative flippase GtrA